ncbi:putative cytokinetic ring protein SteA [Corynebacterium caspium]|uniref:putative cytokinetic ring protein SteA n=1 Tax=Corynebacterium caspium TaxID=234828 RepID=UPI00035F519C|nr:putative cytokinetic ring protein SteA [Corynebacterium caspium]WKD59350.1 hypothetical protein CCASP_04775 [Corynebacterium caspium DSM 44850]
MAPMALFSRKDDLPGIHGTLRDLTTPYSKGFRRFDANDIAVIDASDISRSFAQQLIDMHPAVVINIAHFSTGTVPNFGPQMLLDAGIVLVDAVGAAILGEFKDGKKARVEDSGSIYIGQNLIGSGSILERTEVISSFVESQQSLVDHMEAYFGNTIEFVRSEAPLLIDGLGIPDTGVDLFGRKALVVSPGPEHKEQLTELRGFIREFNPVIIGVNEAADTILNMGYKLDLVIGDPVQIAAETLRSGARVILPADPDGHAVGLERIQDLGVGAMTFPTAISSATDLALLLADYHGAEIIVNVGAPVDLDAIFHHGTEATPSALLSRLKAGATIIDAATLAALYRPTRSVSTGWLWAILGILVAAAAIVVVVGLSGDLSFAENLIQTWNNFVLAVQGLFR